MQINVWRNIEYNEFEVEVELKGNLTIMIIRFFSSSED